MAITRHGYFMIQVQAEPDHADGHLRGVLENLTTGAKHRFESPDEIAMALRQWGDSVVRETDRQLPSADPTSQIRNAP